MSKLPIPQHVTPTKVPAFYTPANITPFDVKSQAKVWADTARALAAPGGRGVKFQKNFRSWRASARQPFLI
jgi:hypothetical protein